MSAFEELTASGGAGGPQTLALLRRLGAQFARTRSFPPPEGHARWDGPAVDDLLSVMFEKKGPVLLTACLVKATDEQSLERLLLKVIDNFYIDEAKGTERGKLRRRLVTLLTADVRFVRMSGPSGWALAAGPTEPWHGDLDTLHRAAYLVRGVQILRLNTAGPTPAAASTALKTVALSVLTAAAGAVRDEDLARVLEGRFELLRQPVLVPLSGDGAWTGAATTDSPEDTVADADERAEQLWASMSTVERALLPNLSGSAADFAVITGTGVVAATATAEGLREGLRLALQDDGRPDLVLAQLKYRCARLAVTRPA